MYSYFEMPHKHLGRDHYQFSSYSVELAFLWVDSLRCLFCNCNTGRVCSKTVFAWSQFVTGSINLSFLSNLSSSATSCLLYSMVSSHCYKVASDAFINCFTFANFHFWASSGYVCLSSYVYLDIILNYLNALCLLDHGFLCSTKFFIFTFFGSRSNKQKRLVSSLLKTFCTR